MKLCGRPFKLPRRKHYKVLTDFTDIGGKVIKHYSHVWAANEEDAIQQFERIVVWCGEPVVKRID